MRWVAGARRWGLDRAQRIGRGAERGTARRTDRARDAAQLRDRDMLIGRLAVAAHVRHEEAVLDLSRRARNADERDGRMLRVVRECQMQRGARVCRIERAVAGSMQPLRGAVGEGRVAGIAPVAHAGRVAAEARLVGVVSNDTAAVETDGPIGVALAGGERIAEADDQPVLDLDARGGDGCAIDDSCDLGPGRVGDLDRHGGVAGSGADATGVPPTDHVHCLVSSGSRTLTRCEVGRA